MLTFAGQRAVPCADRASFLASDHKEAGASYAVVLRRCSTRYLAKRRLSLDKTSSSAGPDCGLNSISVSIRSIITEWQSCAISVPQLLSSLTNFERERKQKGFFFFLFFSKKKPKIGNPPSTGMTCYNVRGLLTWMATGAINC